MKRREFISLLGGAAALMSQRRYIGRSSRTIGCHRSRDRCPLTRRLREGSSLTLRTRHTTINCGILVLVRSFLDTSC
jgi:hypothetical protein